MGVAGNIRVLNKKNSLTKLQAYEYVVSMEMGRRRQGIVSGILVIPGAFGAFRRKIIESLGRMHSNTITEDFDLTLMLQKVREKLFSRLMRLLGHMSLKLGGLGFVRG